jgi:hypothetical protein
MSTRRRLPAGQRAGFALGQRCQVQLFEHLVGALGGFGFPQAVAAALGDQFVVDAVVLAGAVVLADVADAAAYTVGISDDVAARHGRRAFGRR